MKKIKLIILSLCQVVTMHTSFFVGSGFKSGYTYDSKLPTLNSLSVDLGSSESQKTDSLLEISAATIGILALSLLAVKMDDFHRNIENYINPVEEFLEEPKELFDFFEKLKKDLNVPAEVNLKILDVSMYSLWNKNNCDHLKVAFLHKKNKDQQTIYLSRDSLGQGICGIIKEGRYIRALNYLPDSFKLRFVAILVHQLELARQNAKCPGTYQGTDSWQKHRSAEKEAVKYFKCPECLKILQSDSLNSRFLQEGSFLPEEYIPYIQEANKNHDLCSYHSQYCKRLFCSKHNLVIDSEKIASTFSLFNV